MRRRGILGNRRRQELSGSLNRYLISSYPTITGEELDLYPTEADTIQELLVQFRHARDIQESDSESGPSAEPGSSVNSEAESAGLIIPEQNYPGCVWTMANISFAKQMTFSREKDTPPVREFLDNLELSFLYMEGNTTPE